MTGRIVITGAGGLVGRVLAGQAREQGRDVVALTSSEWDITDAAAAERFIAADDVVVNCAGYTKVDAAEADPDRAYAVNATGPENLAQACARAGRRLHPPVHRLRLQRRVPGGRARRPYDIDDETGPLSVYGRTKLAGEFAVLAAMPDAHIVRTAWIYEGGDGTDFVAVMRRAALESEDTVDVVADQIGSPTYVGDLVRGAAADRRRFHPRTRAARRQRRRGQPVRAGAGDLRRGGGRPGPGPAGRQRPHPRPAPRPPYSALSEVKSAAAGLTPLRPWRDALAEALAQRAGPLPSTP